MNVAGNEAARRANEEHRDRDSPRRAGAPKGNRLRKKSVAGIDDRCDDVEPQGAFRPVLRVDVVVRKAAGDRCAMPATMSASNQYVPTSRQTVVTG